MAEPTDYKPLPTVGRGAYEVRVQIEGAWRAIYVAKLETAIYVLHAFQKKAQRHAKMILNSQRNDTSKLEFADE